MTLALADANTGRLLRTLSLDGPISAHELSEQLRLPLEHVDELLRYALTIGVVRRDSDEHYRVEPVVVIALVHQNRTKLLGAAT